jgi:diadenosine tetraphosphate (Ap4A) HIT family hydrolase
VAVDACEFCGSEWYRDAELVIATERCVFVVKPDPSSPPNVLLGGGVIVPVDHRPSPFHLTAEEWAETRELLVNAREVLHERLAPDGYTIGWNDFPTADQVPKHAHLQVVPRFDDEPLWATGLRSAMKVRENTRPDPMAPGKGRAMIR